MIGLLRRLLPFLLAVVPLVFATGFFEGFVTPRAAFVAALIAPLAFIVVARDDEAWLRARAPLACLGLLGLAGTLPHLTGTLDGHALAHWWLTLAVPAAFVMAGAAVATDEPNRDRLLTVLVASALPVLAIGWLRRNIDRPLLDSLRFLVDWLPDRADVGLASTLGNSNALAEFAAPVFAAGAVLVAATTGLPRTLRRLGMLAAVALVVLSRSRGGLLAVAAAMAVVAARWVATGRTTRHGVVRRTATIAAAVLLAIAAVVWVPALASVRDQAGTMLDATQTTNAVRIGLWTGGTALARSALPLGVGGGRFEAAFLPFREPAEWVLSGLDTRADHPHQEWILAAAEAGLVGLIALAAFIAVAFRRGWRLLKSDYPSDHPVGLAVIVAAVSWLVLSLIRAPFSHAGGVLMLATLNGAAGPRGIRAPAGLGRALGRTLTGVVVAVTAVIAIMDASADHQLGTTIDAVNRVKIPAGSAPAAAVRASIRAAGEGLAQVPAATLKMAARSFRAALAAADMAAARPALVAAGVPDGQLVDFPDDALAQELLDETLKLEPWHPGAVVTRTALLLRLGRVRSAEEFLTEAIAALPRAPRLHENLSAIMAGIGEPTRAWAALNDELTIRGDADEDLRARRAALALGLGSDAATFGRQLVAEGAADDATTARRLRALERRDSGDLSGARHALLLTLDASPTDAATLAALADVDYALGVQTSDDSILAEATRAVARSRVRMAVAALAADDARGAAAFVRLARQKDSLFLDAIAMDARVAVARNDLDSAAASLVRLRGARISAAAIRDAFGVDALWHDALARPPLAAAVDAAPSRPTSR